MSRPPFVYMITQDIPVIDRRIILQAQSLQQAGYKVRILTQASFEATQAINLPAGDDSHEVEGIAVEYLATRGHDPRYGWLYRLGSLGGARGRHQANRAVTVLGVLHGYNTFRRLAPYWAARAKADIYTAHDLDNLQVAMLAARANSAPVVYDAHELYPEISYPLVKLRKNYWTKVEARLLPKVAAASTVNEFIADEMAKRYHVPPPAVIYNATNPPPGFDLANPPNLLREKLGLAADQRIALFQGQLAPGRGLDKLVLAASHLAPNIHLAFMGYGNLRPVLAKLAEAQGTSGRVHFLDAVPQSELIAHCASADAGLIPYQPVDLNNYYCSPNKLFDFIVAGLPIVANDLPFLHKMVVGNGLGEVATMDSPQQIAEAINKLLGNESRLRQTRSNLLKAAQVYNWTNESKKLLAIYQQVAERLRNNQLDFADRQHSE